MIINNSIKCLSCNDIITSYHRHDFKFCKCSKVAVDGGNDYLRRLGNYTEYQDLSVTSDAPFEVIREYKHRYNKYSGTYVKLKDMSDSWLQNVIDYLIDISKKGWTLNLARNPIFQIYLKEKLYRAENEIFVPEVSNYEIDFK